MQTSPGPSKAAPVMQSSREQKTQRPLMQKSETQGGFMNQASRFEQKTAVPRDYEAELETERRASRHAKDFDIEW